MHRGQKYENLDSVKKELEDVVLNLAPDNLNSSKVFPLKFEVFFEKKFKFNFFLQIDFLTLGTDLGKRTVVHQGKSPFSGDYVIEDVEHENGDKFRRLYFMTSQLVVQSEARLTAVKSKKGKCKVDLFSLTCQHHVYMSAAVARMSKVCVLGLGGGGLTAFLHKFLTGSAEISAVEIDPEMLEIATKWFDFRSGPKLKVFIKDGLDFIKEMPKNGT